MPGPEKVLSSVAVVAVTFQKTEVKGGLSKEVETK